MILRNFDLSENAGELTRHREQWQSILVIFASQLISSIAMFFNSRCASVYHIGYPVVARSVFGMWGSYYFVGARAALAVIWYGVQRKFLLEGLIERH